MVLMILTVFDHLVSCKTTRAFVPDPILCNYEYNTSAGASYARLLPEITNCCSGSTIDSKVAFCLLKDLTAFCFKDSLRFASRPHCVLLQGLIAFCFKTSLRFASRPHCVLLQDLIAFCFKLSLCFALTSLRFAQDFHCVLLKDHIAF
ncbi:hypothetical protein Tco_1012877 [Tanacetum coccineum]